MFDNFKLRFTAKPKVPTRKCHQCNKPLGENFAWFYDEDHDQVFCSKTCLEDYLEQNGPEQEECTIIGCTHCTYYLKCQALGNLRTDCGRIERNPELLPVDNQQDQKKG